MLTKIAKNQLNVLRELYKADWPKNIIAYGLLDHYIRRFDEYPEWEDKVSFLTLENSPKEDATFAFVNGDHIYFDSLEKSSRYRNAEKLINNLDLDFSTEKVLVAIRDDFRPIVQNFIRVQHLEQTFDSGAKTIISMFSKEELEKLIPKLSNEYYYGPLEEKHAEFVNDQWHYKYPGSVELMKTQIKYSPSTGLFKSNGELISWLMINEFGGGGSLHVVDEYRRLGFATAIGYVQALKLANVGRYTYGYALHQNYKSFKFLMKYGKLEWIDNNSWIGVKRAKIHEHVSTWRSLKNNK